MAKYINADELIKAIETELWDWKTVDGIKSSTVLKQTISDIKNMPAADVVEVVRCKDCKYSVCIGEHYFAIYSMTNGVSRILLSQTDIAIAEKGKKQNERFII